ncbi:MAG: class A beta-lactamase-related serine hydrolase [Gammaproteobacteria bacterium]|nr:class A beta-lactamase-related serine hydrolase [Gammaproteobacteria bacterium]
MYLYERHHATPSDPPPRFIHQFGEAAAVAAVAPKGLVLLEHFHSPKRQHPSIAGTFITAPITRLDVRDMNPGFIDKSDNLITDTSSTGLQTCLSKLITTQFQDFLGKKGNLAPSQHDRLRVALVDLTGHKLTRPDFAGWGSTVSMYGASVPKILALYAAFQLRRDLRNVAATQNISTGKALKSAAISNWKISGLKSGVPNLIWLFDIHKWSGMSALDFSSNARNAFGNITKNCPAGELIARIGFPYIASLTWQSGLRHPTRGGLWLPAAYCSKGSWRGNPIRVSGSNSVTALSVDTYFTLLAQGRLVDDVSSNQIKAFLKHGCVTSLFPTGLGMVASKCGIWSDYVHDCALIVRGSIRYVVVGLTRLRNGEGPKYTQLFRELDNVIVRNNQTPKPTC